MIEHGVASAEALLVGRAARGHVDGGVTLHVRVYTEAPIRRIVEVLVDHGYEEPTFETANTPRGRLDRIRLTELDREILLTRCPPEVDRRGRDRGRDLFTGKPIETANAERLRARLAAGRDSTV